MCCIRQSCAWSVSVVYVGEFIFTSENLFGRYDCYLFCYFSVCVLSVEACAPINGE